MNRTLVKSPPELWPEFSEVERLANHLGEFGEITISRLEPEHAVAWEGEHACGTVELEASGWGTKVTLKAEVREVEAAAARPPPEPPAPTVHQVIPDLEAWDRAAAEIESHARRQTAPAQRAAERAAERAHRMRKGGLIRGLIRRLFRRRPIELEAAQSAADRPQPPPALEPATAAEPSEEGGGAGPAVDEERARAVLEAALDKLGAAHRRPFSRG